MKLGTIGARGMAAAFSAMAVLASGQTGDWHTLTVNPGAGAVILAPNQPYYATGTVVRCTAVAPAGSVFTQWSGGVTSTDNPLALTVTGATALTASFRARTAAELADVLDLYVSPTGTYAAAGTEAAPTTLEGARDRIRVLPTLPAGGVRVRLLPGVYERTASFALEARDSGRAERRIVYWAQPGTVRIVGGLRLNAADFHPSSDPRLDPEAQGHVWATNLAARTTNYGSLASRAPGGWYEGANEALELFCDARPMQLARYPDYARSEDVYVAPDDIRTLTVTGNGLNPDVSGTYTYQGIFGERPYYQMVKNGTTWSIYCKSGGSTYYLISNYAIPGTVNPMPGFAWFAGSEPRGSFSPDSAAVTGSPYVSDGREERWGFMQIAAAASATRFTYTDTRADRWAGQADAYAFGYWGNFWSAQHAHIDAVDAPAHALTITDPAYDPAARQPFFAYNLVGELTAPGEYYLDRTSGVLLFRPPGDALTGEMTVSLLQAPLLTLTGVEHVTFSGITFECARDTGVAIAGGANCRLENCAVRNVGGHGIALSGRAHTIEGCTLLDAGKSGVLLSGGNRATLDRGGNAVRNCEIARFGRLFWAYNPGVNLGDPVDDFYNSASCGNVIEHNHIHHAPHAGVLLKGNEHLIRYNDIHDVCQWSSDMGAVYAGRDWGLRGNFIGWNFIHDIHSLFGPAQYGVYLDDVASGVTIFGNIFHSASPDFPILLGGGRDNLIENNVFAGHPYTLFVDNRAPRYVRTTGTSNWNLLLKIQHFNFQQPPWSLCYPALAAMPNTGAEITGTHWLQPEGNVFSHNLGVHRIGMYRLRSFSGVDLLSYFAEVAANASATDAGFSDPASGDFSLRPDSPALAIPGFENIPWNLIGIQTASAPPTVSAGTDQSVRIDATTVTLAGTVQANGATITAHTWSQVSGPNSATIATPAGLTTTIGGLALGTYVFRLTVSYGTGLSTSDEVAVAVTAVPVPASPLLREAVAGNSIVTLRWDAVPDATGYRVKWGVSSGTYENHADVGAGTEHPVPGLVNAVDYAFAVSAFNAGGEGGNSNELRATPYAPLAIATQPVGQTVRVGGAASFHVVADGSILTYQWRHDGAPLTGATAATLALGNVQYADAGSYDVVVNGIAGSVTSDAVVLIVHDEAYTNFAAWETGNAVAGGPLADPSGAGVPNLLRYAFKLPPLGPLATPPTGAGFVDAAGGRFLTIAFTRKSHATDIVYTVEASGDLATWATVATILPGVPEAQLVHDTVPLSATSRRFLRVRATAP